MKSDIQNYLKLQTALINEKAKSEARLNAINQVLGGDVSVAASTPAAATTTTKAKRTMSEATKAKMRAAHQARWAKLKGKTAPVAAPAPVPKKAKRIISPEAKARMIAGAKKRWAKVNAVKKAA